MPKIQLNDVTVAYPVIISNRQMSAFATAAATVGFGRLARGGGRDKYVVALNHLSLDIAEGSRIGLIGRNGSGKSTLLRTIAGIIHPRSGKSVVDGSVGCLLGIGAGLDPEKSGLENLRLIARLHGLNGATLKNAVDEAADFTELGMFLDMPTRTYSTGMSARLAFAIATSHNADILLIDEVIGTGDAHFVHKAIQRVKSLCTQSGIVLLASHSSDIMSDFCEEAIWLDSGNLIARGAVDDVFAQYAAVSS